MSWLDENPNCARTYAAFRLVGDFLDSDDVTRVLTLQPNSVLAKGQEIPEGRIGPVRRQRTGVWMLSTDEVISSTSLERHLSHLLEALEPAAAALQVLVSAEDVRADFFCYWRSATGDGGPDISPQTLGRIAAIQASLGIDFHPAVNDR